MRVQDVMSQPIRTVRPDLSAEEAWNVMRTAGVRHLVVVGDAGIRGVFSDRDAGSRRGAQLRKGRTVGELMTSPAVSVPATATIRQAANLMRGRSIGCLVVGDARRISGIITTADLLTLLGRGAERPVVEGRRWTLKHRSPHRKATQAAPVW
jgi:CBS domain-containing protein